MKRWIILFLVLSLTAVGLAQEKRDITNQSVQNPSQLRQLLVNRFGLVESDIADLQASNSLGRSEIFYVYSGTGSDSYTGADKDHPLATLDAALGKCTADRGDIIIVLQNHAETLAGADAVDLDVAGVTVIGLGSGTDRPTFTFDTTSDEFVLGRDGDNVTIYNLCFAPAVSEVVHGVDIEDGADNVAILNCEFLESATASWEFDKMITVAVEANDLTIVGCRFTSADAAGASDAIEIGDGVVTRLTIQDCWFNGDFDPACIFSDQSNVQMLIDHCNFTNTNASEPLLEFTGTGSTGIVRNCTFVNDGTANDMGGVMPIGNLAVTQADTNTDAWTFDLGTNNLDHLMKTAVADDSGAIDLTEIVDKTALSWILSHDGDTATFVPSTMALSKIATYSLASQTAAEKIDTNTELRTLLTGSDTAVATGTAVTTVQGYTDTLEASAEKLLAGLKESGVSVGSVFYLDSGAGSDANNGTSWEQAEATLSAAIGDCTSNKGDIIFVAPGHTETWAAAQLTLNKVGIKIIGLGLGSNRPLFIFNNAAASWDITVANVWLENLVLRADADNVLIGVHLVDASHYCTFKNCEFLTGSTKEFLTAIQVDTGADNLNIDGCRFMSLAAGANYAISDTVGICDQLTIKNCVFLGDYAVAAIGSDQINTNMVIANNIVANDNAGDFAIELTAAATGMLVNNSLYSNARATMLDPGSLKCVGNIGVDAIDESGSPIPDVGDNTDNYVGTNSSNNDATTASVVANHDGSSVERLEALLQTGNGGLGYNKPNYLAVRAPTAGSFDTTGAWATAASHEILTVTGAVQVTILPEIIETLVSVSDNGTMTLGDQTTAAAMIAATTIGSGLGAVGEWWVDNSLDDTFVSKSKIDALTGVVGASKHIGYTVGTNALSDGAIIFHVWWTPIDATGAVVSGGGGSL